MNDPITEPALPEETQGTRSAPIELAFNGKFLSAHMTGVHRVADELLTAIDRLVAPGDYQLRIIKPKDSKREMELANFDEAIGGALTWQFWEQFDLPRLVGKDELLISLCNLSPLASARAVTMIHDAQVYLTPQSYSLPFRAWYKFVLPRIGRKTQAVLTVSDFSRQQLVRHGVAPVEKIHVIHNGVDHILRSETDPSIVSRLELETRQFVCALANTQKHKNIQVLFKAFARAEMSQMKLVLMGSSSKSDFEDMGLVVPGNVVFAGRVSDAEMRSLMEAALCFACPSTTEGFGLPPLESMLLGTPAICAPMGALPEVCGSHAVYAEHDDGKAWADAMAALAGDGEDWSRRSVAGREHAKTFTWERAAKQLLAVIETLSE